MEFGENRPLWGTPLIDFNYGTSKHTQLKIEIPSITTLHSNGGRGVRGLGNTNIGVRSHFCDGDEKGRLALSVYPQIEFNSPGSAARRLGIVDRGPEFLMPVQWEMHWGKFGVNGDVGYRLKRGEDEMIYGVLVGREFKRFDLLAEVHGTGAWRHLNDSETVFNLGTHSSHKTRDVDNVSRSQPEARSRSDLRRICGRAVDVLKTNVYPSFLRPFFSLIGGCFDRIRQHCARVGVDGHFVDLAVVRANVDK